MMTLDGSGWGIGVQLGMHLRLNDKLQTLNPVRILNRGYAVLLDNRGKAVTLPSQIPAGSEATAILAHGSQRPLELRN